MRVVRAACVQKLLDVRNRSGAKAFAVIGMWILLKWVFEWVDASAWKNPDNTDTSQDPCQ